MDEETSAETKKQLQLKKRKAKNDKPKGFLESQGFTGLLLKLQMDTYNHITCLSQVFMFNPFDKKSPLAAHECIN